MSVFVFVLGCDLTESIWKKVACNLLVENSSQFRDGKVNGLAPGTRMIAANSNVLCISFSSSGKVRLKNFHNYCLPADEIPSQPCMSF